MFIYQRGNDFLRGMGIRCLKRSGPGVLEAGKFFYGCMDGLMAWMMDEL